MNLHEHETRVHRLRMELDVAEAELTYARANFRRHNILDQVLIHIKEGRRINAIKELRQLPEGDVLGLRDAKDIIEFICNNFNPKV